jgi:anaerobic glycerol-3-phosphate dehydrogenase
VKIAIIGGGIAGAAAAHEVARLGGRATVFHAQAGASALYSGALDFEPWNESRGVVALSSELVGFAAELGVWELTAAPVCVATPEGNVRPARGCDRSVLNLELCAGRRVALVELPRDDWDARLLAKSYASSAWARKTQTRFDAVRVRALHSTFERRISAYDFALAHDVPERLAFLSDALLQSTEKPDAWLFGPWLGLQRSLAGELSTRLGVPIGETTSLPGGASGARFEAARDHLLTRVAHVERERVLALEPSSGGFSLTTRAFGASEFASVILATGGVAAGGIVLERSFERRGGTGFRLSFAGPVGVELDGQAIASVSSLSQLDFVERGLGSLLRLGIAISAGGHALGHPGLFVAGDAVAGQPRTALVAASSGLQAGQRAHAHARGAR